MKTTVDFPDELLKAIKLRALEEGKKLNEMMRELLLRGLRTEEPRFEKARLRIDEQTGLPVIVGGKTPKSELTPAQLSEILIEQEASYNLPPR